MRFCVSSEIKIMSTLYDSIKRIAGCAREEQPLSPGEDSEVTGILDGQWENRILLGSNC